MIENIECIRDDGIGALLEREAEKWLVNTTLNENITGIKKGGKAVPDEGPAIVIVNYHLVWRSPLFSKLMDCEGWAMLILDEAHYA